MYLQGRFTQYDYECIRYLFDAILGGSAYSHCMVVFTHVPPSFVNTKQGKALQKNWLMESKSNPQLAEILERCGERVVFVCNEPDSQLEADKVRTCSNMPEFAPS